MRKAMWGVWTASILSVVAISVASAWSLPDRIAIHFNPRGQPNDWTSKTTFYIVWVITVGAGNAIPLLIGKAASSALRRDPKKASIPRKDYWLATPERTEEASGILGAGAAGIATSCNALFFQIFLTVRSYALTSAPRPMSWTFFAPSAVLLILSIAYIVGSLYRPTGER
ncbi:MAG: DUF1648 domain-containing protein [Planctomycetota bacterium]|jgi:uncharacterized membrane protein